MVASEQNPLGTVTQDGRCLVRDSNRLSTECKSRERQVHQTPGFSPSLSVRSIFVGNMEKMHHH